MTRALFPPTVHAEAVHAEAVHADAVLADAVLASGAGAQPRPVRLALATVTAYLATVKPSLDRAAVRWHDSLTADLGFDSVDLVSLAATIREEHEEVDLRSWIATAGADGDTVGTLAEFLDALCGRTATGAGNATGSGTDQNGRAA